MMDEPAKLPILIACEKVGGQAEMARLLDVTPGFINQMVKGRRQVPAEYCPQIERFSAGNVLCEQLRPDMDWAYLRRSVAPLADVAPDRRNPESRANADTVNKVKRAEFPSTYDQPVAKEAA